MVLERSILRVCGLRCLLGFLCVILSVCS